MRRNLLGLRLAGKAFTWSVPATMVLCLALGTAMTAGCRTTPSDEVEDIAADVPVEQDLMDLQWLPDESKELTGNERWIQPPKTARITFYVDDRANKTFKDGEMKFTGSFAWNEADNTITFSSSWLPTDGPYPLLYDDGPISQGGHEMEGAVAQDRIFSTEVWYFAEEDETFNYGVLNELDFWMWEGPNGEFTVPKGSTDLFECTPLVLAAFGLIDIKVTVDIKKLNSNFDFVSEWDAANVYLKGSMNMWTPLQILDAGPDAEKGDEVAEDGIFTYVQSRNLGKHTGLLAEGQIAQFTVMFAEGEKTAVDAQEYKILSENQQKGAAEGITAYIKCTEAEGWKEAKIEYVLDSWGSTLNTAVTVTCGAIQPECTSDPDTCGEGQKCINGFCKPWCEVDEDCTGGKKCVDHECKTVVVVSQPTIESIDPAEGPVEGGTVVTVIGTQFQDGATVTFGVSPATQVAVGAGGTSLTCVTPPRPGGKTNVTVTNPDGGEATLDLGFNFLAVNPAPVVTKVDPATGPVTGGNTVKITGSNFLPSPQVYFGQATALDVFFVNSSEVQVKAPAGALGKVTVKLVNSDAKEGELADAYEYVPNQVDYSKLLAPLTVKSLAGDPTAAVYAEVYEVGVTTGNGAGAGLIVQVGYGPDGTDPSANPALWSWDAAEYDSESGNNEVYKATLVDSNVGEFRYTFRFSMDGSNWLYSDGTGNLDGFAVGSCGKWSNLDPAGGPYVFAVEPSATPVTGGGVITLTGAGFTDSTQVTVDGVDVESTFVSGTSVTFVAPAHAAGAVDIAVSNGADPVTLADALFYVLKFTPTVDGNLIEWDPEFLVGTNEVESLWDPELNYLNFLYVSYDAEYLYIAFEGSCEATNYLLGYLDVDYGVGTGVREMVSLADNTGNGDLDDALSNVLLVLDQAFGAEYAFGTGGMGSFTQGSDLGQALKAGWRKLVPTDNFPWVDGSVVCGDTGCEAKIKLATLLGGGIPASGKQFGLFVKLTNAYGGIEGISNQTLPEYYNPTAPERVGNLVKVDVRP